MAKTSWTLGSDSLSQTLTGDDYIDETHINELRTAVNGLETLLDPDNQTLTLVQSSTTGEALDISRNLALSSTNSPIVLFSQLNAGDNQHLFKLVETVDADLDNSDQRRALSMWSDADNGISKEMVAITSFGDITFKVIPASRGSGEVPSRNQGIFFERGVADGSAQWGDHSGIGWCPDGNAAPDVWLTTHKYGVDGSTHKHLSIYTDNASGILSKRLDIDWGSDMADVDWSAVGVFEVGGGNASTNLRFDVIGYAASMRLEDSNQVDPSGRFAWNTISGGFRLLESTGEAWSSSQAIVNYIAGISRIWKHNTNVGLEGNVLYGNDVSGGDLNLEATSDATKGMVKVNQDSIQIVTSQSPLSNGAGSTGEIAWDANYLYVCTTTNTWERVALTGGY